MRFGAVPRSRGVRSGGKIRAAKVGQGTRAARKITTTSPHRTIVASLLLWNQSGRASPRTNQASRKGIEQGTAWLAKPHTEVSASFPSSASHHTAHSPQPTPTASEIKAVLVGFSSVKALPIKYQPTPTLSRACHASPVNEIESGKRVRRITVERVHDDPFAHPAEDRPAEEQRRERGNLEAPHEVEEDPSQEAIGDPGDQELREIVTRTPEGPEDSLREEEEDVAVGEDDGGFA